MPSSDDIDPYFVGLLDGLDPDGACDAQSSFWLGLPIVGFIQSGQFLFLNFDNDRGQGSHNQTLRHFSDVRKIGKLPLGGLYTQDGVVRFQPDKVVPPLGFFSPEFHFKGRLPLASNRGQLGVPTIDTAVYNPAVSVFDALLSFGSLYVSVPPVGVNPTAYRAPDAVQDLLPMRKGYLVRGLIAYQTSEANPHCP